MTPSMSASGAVKYFEEGLKQGDYYLQGQDATGHWHGKLCERLGMSGEVQKQDFERLCQNRKPADNSKLNPRDSINRKVGYDLTFSCPKSVSLLYAIRGDERIREAFERSVEETMQELESEMRIQQGQGKQKALVPGGEMIWASFTHRTSRPLEDGIPDPHLHRHCFVMSTSWNPDLERFQAGEFSAIKKKAPYYEAAFDSRLAMRLEKMGYPVERRGLSFEVAGINPETLTKFSRRTQQVEKAAREEARKQGEISAKQKAELGALTRGKKHHQHRWQTLRQIWQGRLSTEEFDGFAAAGQGAFRSPPSPTQSAGNALRRAEAHLFERKSAVQPYQLKTEALKRSFGHCLPEAIEEQYQARIKKQNYLNGQIKGTEYVTTKEAIQAEQKLLHYIRNGKGKLAPVNPQYLPLSPVLTEEQKAAIKHALQDKNRITIISGQAGTGKTTLMKHVQQGVKAAGKKFFAFAPTAKASRGVMAQEGFENATTLASLLSQPEQQAKVQGGYLWVDEAGLMGVKEMNQLCEIAQRQNARILLTGDTRQHSAISAGDALRLAEQAGGIKIARVTKIQRQRNNPRYKQVVAQAARGNVDTALEQLDRMGGVVELAEGKKRLQQLVTDYAAAVKTGKSCLVIAPTHIEGQDVTQALRSELKRQGKLKTQEREVLQFQPVHLTEEQKSDPFHYQREVPLMAKFHQNAKGFRKGEEWQVVVEEGKEPQLQREGVTRPLPQKATRHFTFFQKERLKLAIGDKIRITKNTKTLEGSRVHNGAVYQVTGFTREGHLRLHTGKTLDKESGFLDYGFVQTSYSAQGATTQRLFLAISSQSQAATSRQQFYVSLSRAREGARIYTDDKKALEKAVKQDERRLTARELTQQYQQRNRKLQDRRQQVVGQESKRNERNHGKAPLR